MIVRYDRLGIEIPSGDPDSAGAMAVHELMGGRFGVMSTPMNYTFQSFRFRGRNELRPIYAGRVPQAIANGTRGTIPHARERQAWSRKLQARQAQASSGLRAVVLRGPGFDDVHKASPPADER
jgi:hypothetical protein